MKLEEYANLAEKKSFFESIIVTTRKEFEEIYNTIKETDLLYRGIHEAKYKIYTSAQREWITNEYSRHGVDFVHFIKSIINNIRKNLILPNYYKSLNIHENDLLYISLLQHYGAPTPLLDFTYDLNTALYFALDKIQQCSSSDGIDNYFSVYIIDQKECGNNLVNIVSLLGHGRVSGEKMLKEFKYNNPGISINYSLIQHIDSYTKWIKEDGTNEGLCKIDCGFLDNPLKSGTISMYETNETLYWSNLNLIAQQGCFIFYPKDKKPLEQYFNYENKYLPKLKCVNIHKSLAEFIKDKYLKSNLKLDIFPDISKMCDNAYVQFKEGLQWV